MALSDDYIRRHGDYLLSVWGEAWRNGEVEMALHASVSTVAGASVPRAPGTHSNPLLSRLLAFERDQREHSRKIALAAVVDGEVQAWRLDRRTVIWHQVAHARYCAPYRRTNSEVASALKVSLRTVEAARTALRRSLVVALCGRLR